MNIKNTGGDATGLTFTDDYLTQKRSIQMTTTISNLTAFLHFNEDFRLWTDANTKSIFGEGKNYREGQIMRICLKSNDEKEERRAPFIANYKTIAEGFPLPSNVGNQRLQHRQ